MKAFVGARRILLSISVAIISFGLATADQSTMMHTHSSDDVIAVVNGDSITSIDLSRLLVSTHQQIPVDQRADFDYNILVTKLINDRLIVQEATHMGMDTEGIIVEPVEKFRLTTAVSAFIKAVYIPNDEVSDEAVQRRFNTNYKRAQVRTVAVTSLEEAEQVYKAISGGASMDSIAREISSDSRAREGGLHKSKFWKDILVELRKPATDLDVGEVSQPFQFEDAYMVLKLEAIEDADPEIFPMAEATINRSLALDNRKLVWDGLLDSLKTLYPVVVNVETLDKIKADSGIVLSGDFSVESQTPVLSIAGMPPVDEARFRKVLSHKAMTAAEEGFAVNLDATLDELTESYLLEASATMNGYLEDPRVVEQVVLMRDSLIVEKYLQENIAAGITIDEAALQDIYDEDRNKWYESGDVKLSVMLCADRETAEQALVMLRDGANFEYVNDRHGIENEYGATANDWRKPESFPHDLAEKVKHLPIGGFADGVYKLPDGYGIFQLTAKQPGKQRSVEEVGTALRSIYFQREFNAAMNQLLQTLKENSQIELYEDRIATHLEG